MMNITTLTTIALAKILMKAHACLLGFTTFALNVFEDEGTYTLSFTAKDTMDGYNMLSIDIISFTSEEEMAEWLANTRVSTRFINTAISTHEQAEEEAYILAEEVEQAAIALCEAVEEVSTTSFTNGSPSIFIEWTPTAGSFFEVWAEDVVQYGITTFHMPTIQRVRHYRKLFNKRMAQ